MMTTRASRVGQRRGIVLVLVLAMLGLMALVGVTFATYAAQSRISNKQFMLSLFQPQADELMDFGLAQLITDTNDIRSVIRGHSMARDMFGNDASFNALLGLSPTTGAAFSIGTVTQVTGTTQYTLTTNIGSNDSAFFGYNFSRWVMQLTMNLNSAALISPGTGTITQSFEIIGDSGYNPNSTNGRVLTINVPNSDANAVLANPTVQVTATQTMVTQLPGLYVQHAAAISTPLGTNSFTLDSRWKNAFNGAGAGQNINTTTGLPASYYPNFRFTGPNTTFSSPGLNPPTTALPSGSALTPGSMGMDEDYDACDLENWFLAIQSADGQVMIPSFHRPAIMRYDPNNNVNDWTRTNQSGAAGALLWADSAARMLRPVKADGHDPTAFADLMPDGNGKINYDVDNDGDGITDSVWLDLGYPARKDSSGRLYKPMFAFMVIGLNGRIPLNTAGNLAAQVAGFTPNDVANWSAYGVPAGSIGAGITGSPTVFGGNGTASHLGNSVSEVDPTYGLQGGFMSPQNTPASSTGIDAVAAFDPPQFGFVYNNKTYLASNTQVDNAGIDVRLTQLRNLLAGTRTADPSLVTNGESNNVLYSTSLTNAQVPLPFPNGIADIGDITNTVALGLPTPTVGIDPGTNMPVVFRSSAPIPGRWGEGQSVPGASLPNPFAPAMNTNTGIASFVNVVTTSYANPVRAGYSVNINDIMNGLAPDAGDDNFNTYDPYPLRNVSVTDGTNTVTVYGGEVGDADFYDAAGALLFPCERMRRWVVPADINGTGTVATWNSSPSSLVNRGADVYGRVEFNSYFRPPGSPGVISTSYTVNGMTGAVTSAANTGVAPTQLGINLGAIFFPQNVATNTTAATNNNEFYYESGPSPSATGIIPSGTVTYPYLPDLTSNPTHSLEAGRFPNQTYTGTNPYTPQNVGGSPVGLFDNTTPPGAEFNVDATYKTPVTLPSYDYYVNSEVKSDGLNDADEQNLYAPNPLVDSPFGPGDLEWLYRQQDVDGASLTSRLEKLATVSFKNGVDGARRRRLYSLDSWDLNTFSWTNDNPVQPAFTYNAATGAVTQSLLTAFPNNSRFTTGANTSYQTVTYPTNFPTATISNVTPGLAHRNKKINLNYPLPVSNDPDETVRKKWINDTYALLKAVLPLQAIDTPEELAALSQYVINIVDFRDTDSTMTHWVNPDVIISGLATPTVTGTGGTATTTAVVPTAGIALIMGTPTPLNQLDQWGMEYNPVAINEVLAYSYRYVPAGSTTPAQANRFFMELVNTQTAPEVGTATAAGFNPVVDLGGYVYNPIADASVAGTPDPYTGAPWDIIFTADDPYSRPDPYRGQLLPYANLYAATPLSQASFTPPPALTGGVTPVLNNPVVAAGATGGGTATDGFDVMLQPLGWNANTGIAGSTSIQAPIGPGAPMASGGTSPLPVNYFYVIGNAPPSTSSSTTTGGTTTTTTTSYEIGSPGPTSAVAATTGQINNPTAATYGVQVTAVGTSVGTLPSQIQTFKSAALGSAYSMDPMAVVTGATAVPSPISLYAGVLPPQSMTFPTTSTVPNPSLTTPLPPNYKTTVPVTSTTGTTGGGGGGGATATAGSYYWVCLRRPANLFAPVSATNPMVVVDSLRFPMVDATAPGTAVTSADGAVSVPVAANTLVPAGTGNVAFSAQRYQPYRGGHAVPVALPSGGGNPPAGTLGPVDPRYGYTEQLVVPSMKTLLTGSTGTGSGTTVAAAPGPGTYGVYYYDTSGTGAKAVYYATQQIYHTLGWANEYEQGSSNGLAEPWDYFPFNDRDFTSVAELLLVPGCSPGLFTKQFVEFAPNAGNVSTIFGMVTPTVVPPAGVPALTILPPATSTTTGGTTTTAGGPMAPTGTSAMQPYSTGSTPFSYAYSTATTGRPSTPQPRTYPYLNDEFFYTGSGAGDVGGVVGGTAGDGWFRMFEFFEVPSQSITAIGTVAAGSNFDWYRNDIKPGQLNLNLIMDEEVFFSVAGKAAINQTNGQAYDPTTNGRTDGAGNPVNPGNQFVETLLNFNQIGPVAPAASFYVLPSSTPANPAYMLGSNSSPVPLVVTSTRANGTPYTAIPIVTNATVSPGVTDVDPLLNFFFSANNPTTATANMVGPPYPNGNNPKAAWVQFLSLRHGGSGFLFGYGLGAVGQNSTMTPAILPPSLPTAMNGSLYGTGIPAERPFRSLSYPDINYTIMRPAALPPSPYTDPIWNPLATTTALGVTTYYAGDPGSRNSTLFVGYPTGTYPGTPPGGSIASAWTTYDPVYPPAIPARRLFQVPDSYKGGTVALAGLGTAPVTVANEVTGTTYQTLVDGPSNASDTGDPFINNLLPIGVSGTNVPSYATGSFQPIQVTNPIAGTTYFAMLQNSSTGLAASALTGANNNVGLYWPGRYAANLYDGTTTTVGATFNVPLPASTTSPPAATATNITSPHLGSNASTGTGGALGNADMREHPYWRTEQLQRMMNLTTPRTHQYAVWMTIGFFEVKRQGDQGMFVFDPRLAFDILGPEIGAANGKSTRYRGFFLVDRLKLTGFNPASPTGFRQAVVYRQRIQ